MTTINKHLRFDEILKLCKYRLPIYVHGPTGSGKTHIFRDIAKEMNVPFYKKLIGAQMTESSLLGYMDATGKYVEGIVFKPYTQGGLLVLDEIDNGNPNTNLVVNGLVDNEIAFPCGMREKHKDFIVVATANTTGAGATLAYVGRNRLDAAMLNRFIFIEFNYDLELESKLAFEEYKLWRDKSKGKDLTKEEVILVTNSIHDFWLVRAAVKELQLSHILSQRNLLQQTRMICAGCNKESILLNALLRQMDMETVKKVMDKAKTLKIEEVKSKLKNYELNEEEKKQLNMEVDKEIQLIIDKEIEKVRNDYKIRKTQLEQLEAVNKSEQLKQAKKDLKEAEAELNATKVAMGKKVTDSPKSNPFNSSSKTAEKTKNKMDDLPDWPT